MGLGNPEQEFDKRLIVVIQSKPMTLEHWENAQRRRGNIPGAEMARTLREQFDDIPFPLVAAAPVEVKLIPQEFRPFTDQEIRALVRDGAVIFDLTGETIEEQRTAGRLFTHVADRGDRLLKLPSMKIPVAIYPDPKRFFIPRSGDKDLTTQEGLARKDGQELRKRLILDDLDVVIPKQAATLTELIFKYLDQTTEQGKGVWLFGSDYGGLYGRTTNPANESGSLVAHVGAGPHGVYVSYESCNVGFFILRVVRLVVARNR